jgi:antitoxin component YwqK of YwqJK toxin-antitoxin module|tara:strand:- start:303 stop:587 length:285 start_codon:yes stop_codon:yes gene_type:complete
MYPFLVEGNIKNILYYQLNECRQKKFNYTSLLFNLACFLILIGLISGMLWYKYKGKLTPHEKYIKENEKKNYIFSKLRKLENMKNTRITNLPMN